MPNIVALKPSIAVNLFIFCCISIYFHIINIQAKQFILTGFIVHRLQTIYTTHIWSFRIKLQTGLAKSRITENYIWYVYKYNFNGEFELRYIGIYTNIHTKFEWNVNEHIRGLITLSVREQPRLTDKQYQLALELISMNYIFKICFLLYVIYSRNEIWTF